MKLIQRMMWKKDFNTRICLQFSTSRARMASVTFSFTISKLRDVCQNQASFRHRWQTRTHFAISTTYVQNSIFEMKTKFLFNFLSKKHYYSNFGNYRKLKDWRDCLFVHANYRSYSEKRKYYSKNFIRKMW
jgi:hypothetical protein